MSHALSNSIARITAALCLPPNHLDYYYRCHLNMSYTNMQYPRIDVQNGSLGELIPLISTRQSAVYRLAPNLSGDVSTWYKFNYSYVELPWSQECKARFLQFGMFDYEIQHMDKMRKMTSKQVSDHNTQSENGRLFSTRSCVNVHDFVSLSCNCPTFATQSMHHLAHKLKVTEEPCDLEITSLHRSLIAAPSTARTNIMCHEIRYV